MTGPFGETVGKYLKRRREARNLSLEEISFSTRMNIEYLEALERDDFQCFPQKEYIEGFMRTYARYVRLDPEEVLRRYHLQIELARMEKTFQQMALFQAPVRPMEAETPTRKFTLRLPLPGWKKIKAYRRILLQIGIVIVAVIFSLYLRKVLQENDKVSKPPSGKEAASAKPHSIPSAPRRIGPSP